MAERKLKKEPFEKLRKMGFNVEKETKSGADWLRITKDGEQALIPFEIDDKLYQNQPVLIPSGTQVPQNWQGKGVATEAYKAMEELTGYPVMPDDMQTYSGYKLHDKKGYGKEFGLSDSQIDEKLKPVERLQRNARKKATMDSLNVAADFFSDSDGAQAGIQAVDKLRNMLQGETKTNTGSIVTNAIQDAREMARSVGNDRAAKYLRENIPRFASKVKSVAPAALMGGLGLAANVAAEASDAEELGRGSDLPINQEQELGTNASREISQGEPLNSARLQALKKLINK